MSEGTTTAEKMRALAAFFDARQLKWKPQAAKNNRAMAVPYVDARLVEERLDDVLGAENWKDHYEVLNDGCVVCQLSVRVDGEWVTKEDVGSPSEQPDGGDRLKASFSDALKRAAVKFGIGRYLYRLPPVWVDYDPQKKQITQIPQLPDWADPGKQRRGAVDSAGPPRQGQGANPAAQGATAGAPAGGMSDDDRLAISAYQDQFAALRDRPGFEALWHAFEGEKARGLVSTAVDKAVLDLFAQFGRKFPRPGLPGAAPSTGQELHARLRDYDSKLAGQRLCQPGALLAHVTQAGVRAGYSANVTDWAGPAISFAIDAVKQFEAGLKRAQSGRQ
jgi:hypothetical protein